VELRTPLVPGVNDDEENLGQLARFLGERGVRALRLVPYHRLYLGKYEALGLTPGHTGLAPPTAEGLRRVKERLEADGLTIAVDG
jgi:pyruvate formate lyase activating enzyme